MGSKRYKPEEIVTKQRQGKALVGQGVVRVDTIREARITAPTDCRWRKQYVGSGTDQLMKLKRLQKENERLRKAVSDVTLDKSMLAKAARVRASNCTAQLLSSARCRVCIDHVGEAFSVSERGAYRVLRQHRPTQTKLPVGRAGEERLIADMTELARQYGRY